MLVVAFRGGGGGAEPGTLRAVYEAFAGFGADSDELDNNKLAKLFRDCGVIDSKFTSVDTDLLWSKICPKGKRKISFAQFEQMLDLASRKKGVNLDELKASIIAKGAPVKNKVSEADTSSGIYAKLTDSSQYTGAHRSRFDAEGHGLGVQTLSADKNSAEREADKAELAAMAAERKARIEAASGYGPPVPPS